MKFKIRNFSEKDLNECVKIIELGLGKKDAKYAKIDFLEGIHPKTNEYVFLKRRVALIKNKIVGICGPYQLVAHPKDYVGICWYSVLSDFRNRGIGTALLKDSEKIAKKRGYKTMFVWATEKAQEFYIKNNFKKSNFKLKPKETDILLLKKL